MKKFISLLAVSALSLALLAGCSSTTEETTESTGAQASAAATSEAATEEAASGDFDSTAPITVVSREEGSGTRGAFVELLGIEEEQEDGSMMDMTTLDAVTVNGTSVVMTTVSGDPYAIGYISLGSLDDTVKALQVDGVDATAENITSGDYTISRPFNIATNGEATAEAQDFIDFILAEEGQAIVADNGYIPLETTGAYAGAGDAEGTIVVAGSTSVAPVMEKLQEAYIALNPNVEIEIQATGSSAGMTAAIDGVCDIGMASRELKDSELEAGLAPTVIALDGIAMVVNSENPMTDITPDQIRSIYVGETTSWDAIA